MNTWAPLWNGIVDSSLWEEDPDVVKVFITMLATKDSDHVCRLDAYKIHRKCNIDEIRVLDILKLLASPDSRRVAVQAYEGRRIKAVEEGWLILNGEKYRAMVQQEMRRASWRRAQAKRRAKKAAAKQGPSAAEDRYVRAYEDGDEERADAIVTGSLPQSLQEDDHELPAHG